MKKLRVSAAAERDLDDIWYYIATNSGSAERANQFVDSITRRLSILTRSPKSDPSSTPLKCKQLLRKDLSVRHERSDTLFHLFDPSLERSVGGIATPQAWKTLPTVPRVSVRTT